MSLTSARYGKDLVRVFRIVRQPGTSTPTTDKAAIHAIGKGPIHDVAEYNVRALVEGDIDASFTEADNSVVVATDSIKNIIYYLAKTSPHVLSPELFATHIGAFLLDRYAHLKRAYVDVERLRWTRIVVGANGGEGAGKVNPNGEAHKHSFRRDGDEKHTVSVEVVKKEKGGMDVSVVSGLTDLLVLKSSGSSFSGFVRDEFTTLAEVDDRILSTAVEVNYRFPKYALSGLEGVGGMEGEHRFKEAESLARGITLDMFATDDSASVQATLFKMGQALIAAHDRVDEVSYVLPNKHYIPVDMRYLGIDNFNENGEVFMPVGAPSGRITGKVSRMTS